MKITGNPYCPTCLVIVDGVTAADGSEDQPEPGSWSVCVYCGEMLRFDDDMQLAVATDPPPQVIMARDCIMLAKRAVPGLKSDGRPKIGDLN